MMPNNLLIYALVQPECVSSSYPLPHLFPSKDSRISLKLIGSRPANSSPDVLKIHRP
jgi:hypothetical protein